MSILDKERSIRLTKRELLLIQDTLKAAIEICKSETTNADKEMMEKQISQYKEIIFKIDKKLNFSSVTDTIISE